MQFQNVYEQVGYVASEKPGSIAIEMGERQVSYQELNARANQIANFFYEKLTERKNVAILLGNSVELVEVILGVMRSGGVFAPLDPEMPENRIKMMLTEIEADWIVTSQGMLAKLEKMMEGANQKINALILSVPGSKSPEVNVAEVQYQNIDVFTFDTNLPTECQVPAEAANKHCYIYFTSGSTGKPKAILGRHRSLKHFIDWEIGEFGIDANFKVSQLTSPSFDPLLRDVFVPLCVGATVCIPETRDVVLSPERLRDWIEASQINLIHTVPTIFKALMAELENGNCFANLKYILLAGELLRGNDVQKFFDVFGEKITLVNLYGATETTMIKLFHRVQPEDAERISVPVGKPMAGAQITLLDEDMQNCAKGTIGEVYIRTPYITSGYYNDRELTRKVFIQNPFSTNPQDIIYKTGDLGRILQSGDLEILGRVDHQVKLRGVRIELGEIENHLLHLPGVKEAVVVAKEDDGNKFLCAYVVSESELVLADLKALLAQELPDVMVPAYFIQIEQMPLTQNGKIDRKALPEPELGQSVEYVAPSTPVEETLVKIWSKVLNVEGIGIDHNFFDLGGHSIKATAIMTKIHKELNVEVPLKEIFLHPTIRQLAACIEKEDESIYTSIKPVEEREYYPISSAQRRLYVLNQLERSLTTYNMPRVLMINGSLDRARLEESIAALLKRHETMRTSFHSLGGDIVQKIHPEVNFQIQYSQSTEHEVQEVIKQFFQPFNLEKAPLFRVGLVELTQEKHLLLFDTHHIVSDGMSTDLLIRDFVGLYQGQELPPLPIQYKDFAVWQNELFTSGVIEKQEQYWLKAFEGPVPVLNMPYDFPRLSVQSFDGDRLRFVADTLLTRRLNTLAKANGATLFMVLLAAYNILLAKYSGQEDIVVGSPIVGRANSDLNNIIGMFINTLPMRNYPKNDLTFKAFLREIKTSTLRAFENQDYQFEQLVNKLNVPRDLSRNPIFDVLFNLHNYEHASLEIEGLNFQPYPMENAKSKFDLTLSAEEGREQIGFIFEYCTKLFKSETIQRMGQHYLAILRQIVENANIALADIEIMLPEEKERVLIEFNQTAVDYDRTRTIHQLFEEQAAKTPESIALVDGDKKLSYREFNEKANQLARRLRKEGVKPDSVVALMIERSLEMMIGIYGILKSGAAYLPIDPDYPMDRVKYVLEDSEASLVLTNDRLQNGVTGFTVDRQTICIDLPEIYQGDATNLEPVSNPENLAYMIYTSGSTGKPKGVMIEHRSVTNFIKGITDRIEFATNNSILALTTVSFDIFGLETLLPLSRGMRVVIANDEHQKDTRALNIVITKNSIDMLQMTPSRLRMLLNDEQSVSCLKNVQSILVGGEALPLTLLEELRAVTKARIYNMYGPTETTIWSTLKDLTGATDVNIGKPIANTTVYILDANNHPQPIGIPGELCIAGEGLARGYWNRPDLTAEKFVQNPFAELIGQVGCKFTASEIEGNKAATDPETLSAAEINAAIKEVAASSAISVDITPGDMLTHNLPMSAKMYRTGDRVRWTPNGEIEFFGRNDEQVKIRGFRIELGEIENQLLRNAAIKAAAVIARDDNSGSKYLCAYVVGEGELSVADLKVHLSKELPDYMIPTYIIQLDALPYTPNGKIDRNSLPEPNAGIVSGVEYVAPGTEIEEKLVKIWQEVLGIEGIGVHHNFFEIGGNSINIMKVISLISKQMGIQVPLGELFMRPTVAELAGSMFQSDPLEGFESLIRLNKPTPGKKNVFILHTWEGIVYQYKEIAKQLEGEYNVYGIQAKGVTKPAKLPETLEEMVTDYIVEIKAIQPEGPYTIAGYCYGNWIAYKMIEMLEDRDVPIDRLIEIDENAWLRDDVRKYYRGRSLISAPYRFVRTWVRKLTRGKKNPMDYWPSLEEYKKSKPPVEGEIKNDMTVRENVNRLCAQALLYKRLIETDVYVIKAEENNLVRYTKEDWEKQTFGKVWFVEIPGGHETIFNYPYVDELVKMMRRALEE